MTVGDLDRWLMAGSLVLLLAVGAVRLSSRTGLPSLLVYLAFGLALGEGGLGIEFDDASLARVLGYAALVVILAEGGLTTRWSTIRPHVPAAASLAVVGSTVSILVTAVAAMALLDFDWWTAVLLGAVVAPTDAAAVFSVLRRLPLPPRLVGLLEAESGFNDAPVIILIVALSTTRPEADPLELAGLLVMELTVGGVVGTGIGLLGAWQLRRVALPASGLYPVAVMSFAVAAYAAASLLHGSGFLAVYLAAVVLGNSRLPHRPATRGFAEGLAWLAQIGLFVMLGLLASPGRLPDAVLPALGIGLVLLLLARPLSVMASVTPFRLGWREQGLLSWAGLRGAVPIVFATVPLTENVPDGELIFDLVFVLVVVFTLVQAPSLPALARRLNLTADAGARELEVEAVPLEHLRADMLYLRVLETSQLHGVEVFELRLPPGAAVTLVVRDGKAFVPTAKTTLRHGDELLLVATADVRDETERRLRAVSRRGRLAGWFRTRRRE